MIQCSLYKCEDAGLSPQDLHQARCSRMRLQSQRFPSKVRGETGVPGPTNQVYAAVNKLKETPSQVTTLTRGGSVNSKHIYDVGLIPPITSSHHLHRKKVFQRKKEKMNE